MIKKMEADIFFKPLLISCSRKCREVRTLSIYPWTSERQWGVGKGSRATHVSCMLKHDSNEAVHKLLLFTFVEGGRRGVVEQFLDAGY